LETPELQTQNDLLLKKIQLHWLLQITKAVNYNLPAPQLFEIYKNVLVNHLHIGKLLLFVHENSWTQILSHGVNYRDFNIDPEKDLEGLHEYIPHSSDSRLWLKEFDTIIPVIHHDKALGYAFLGNYSNLKGNQKEILAYIHTITNIIIVAIENKRLTKESITRVTMQKELQLAAEMQAMLFPESLDGFNVFDIAATYLPHHEVGGDFYDFFRINDHESLVCMADVSGKGMAAALLMSNFQAHLRALTPHFSSLPDLVRELNRSVYRNAKGEKYITVFIARIHHDENMIRFVNAGHNPPFLFHQNLFTDLADGTTGLGMFEELPFLNEGEISFPENSILICYTDGITDLEDAQGNFFGIENFHSCIRSYSSEHDLNLIHQRLKETMNEFRKEKEYNDDVTLMTIRLRRTFP